MKVIIVFGILLVLALCEGQFRRHQKYCCNHMKHISDVEEANEECVSFSELVEQRASEHLPQKQLLPHETLFERVKAKAKAFSDASLECIANNQIFRNVHTVVDDLHSVLEGYPVPSNVLKKISEAMDTMEEHFDDLHGVHHPTHASLSGEMLDRIGNFVRENIGNAVGIFEKNNLAASVALEAFKMIPIEPVLNKLVDTVEHSLGFKLPFFRGLFEARQDVRSTAKELSNKVAELQHKSTYHSLPHQQSIDRLLSNFNSSLKELKLEMEADKLKQKRG